ncbi:MAG: YtxH domain-containing protein [Candidatus Gastranaerophilales bacterium]|nr:YtxH domain-containing protein [Candidatus Gastranaerophilales bacterium]
MSVGKFLAGFVVGGIVGGVVGLLLAPQSGEETREMLLEGSEDLYDKTESSIKNLQKKADTVVDEIQKKGDVLLDKVQDLIDKGKSQEG